MMHVIGENTPEEMALPPEERRIKVGTEMKMGAVDCMFMLDEFVNKFMDALGKTADDEGQCHPEYLDVLSMAREYTCKKIREQWKREWEEKQKQEKAS